MNKKTLSESDICDKFIRPAIEAAGWDGMSQIYREYPLRAGCVVVRGHKDRRDSTTVMRTDYALFFKAIQVDRAQAMAVDHSLVAVVLKSTTASTVGPNGKQERHSLPLRRTRELEHSSRQNQPGTLRRSSSRPVHGSGIGSATVEGTRQLGGGSVRRRGRACICIATSSLLCAISHGAPAQDFHAWGRGRRLAIGYAAGAERAA